MINKEVKTLFEYEYYIDKRGYAHDDEDNVWYVGTGKGETYGLYGPKQRYAGGPKKQYASWKNQPKNIFPENTTNELEEAIEEAIAKARGEKTKDFLSSLLNQYQKKGSLSNKQKAVMAKIFKQLGLDNSVKYIEM